MIPHSTGFDLSAGMEAEDPVMGLARSLYITAIGAFGNCQSPARAMNSCAGLVSGMSHAISSRNRMKQE